MIVFFFLDWLYGYVFSIVGLVFVFHYPKIFHLRSIFVLSLSVMSDSLQLHGLYSTRLLHPWDFLGKNIGVGCHFLLQGNLPNPRTEPESLTSPALAGGFFTTSATRDE